MKLSQKCKKNVLRNRAEIEAILSGKDKRKLLIIGPCSAWPYEAMIDYANRLLELEKSVKDVFKIVLRTYICKPRTTCGWMGPLIAPDPFKKPNVKDGFVYAEKLMAHIAEMGIALADEAVYPRNAKGFVDLLSWIAIGARSTENQEHRVFASSLNFPVGIKNPTSGSIQIGVNGVIAAQNPQIYFEKDKQIITDGNKDAHLVLRGGYLGPNYQTPHLLEAESLLLSSRIKNPSIIVDLSHDNAILDGEKNPHAQNNSAYSVIDSLKNWVSLRKTVKGFMVESFIKTGCQDLEKLSPEMLDYGGLSITDPCLGWEETKALVLELAKALKPYTK